MISKPHRPFLDSLIAGHQTDLSREDTERLIAEAAPRLRSYNGPATPPNRNDLPWLVVGSAASIHRDISLAPPHGPIVAVNRAILDLDITPDIGCTLHHEITQSIAEHYDGRLFCSRGTDYVTDVLPVREDWRNGSSGLYAVQVALHLGAKSVILCGIPIDDSAHFHGDHGLSRGDEAVLEMHRKPWRESAKELHAANVRSMSGWTRHLLGSPLDYNI